MTSPTGLSTAEARRRLAEFGFNEIETAHRFRAVRTLAGFVLNPLVLILMVASQYPASWASPV
jgi:hypothetical protein